MDFNSEKKYFDRESVILIYNCITTIACIIMAICFNNWWVIFTELLFWEGRTLEDYVRKDDIKKFQLEYDKSIKWANEDDRYYFNKWINDILLKK